LYRFGILALSATAMSPTVWVGSWKLLWPTHWQSSTTGLGLVENKTLRSWICHQQYVVWKHNVLG